MEPPNWQALLFLTSRWFDQRIGHLAFLFDGIANEISNEDQEPFSAGAPPRTPVAVHWQRALGTGLASRL